MILIRKYMARTDEKSVSDWTNRLTNYNATDKTGLESDMDIHFYQIIFH